MDCPSYVECTLAWKEHSKKHHKTISTLQLKANVKKGVKTYVTKLVKIKPNQYVEVLDAIASILEDFVDVMAPKLPIIFPPRSAFDHKIELELSARPPSFDHKM